MGTRAAWNTKTERKDRQSLPRYSKHWMCLFLFKPGQQSYGVGTIIMPILQMSKLKHR